MNVIIIIKKNHHTSKWFWAGKKYTPPVSIMKEYTIILEYYKSKIKKELVLYDTYFVVHFLFCKIVQL